MTDEPGTDSPIDEPTPLGDGPDDDPESASAEGVAASPSCRHESMGESKEESRDALNCPGEPLWFKYWAKCEDTAIHFNDLAIKFRLQALAGLALAGALLGGAVKTTSSGDMWALLAGGLVALAAMWLAVAALDVYYGRLLRGSIDELEAVERKFPALQLSKKIEEAVWGKWGPGISRTLFYLLPLGAMLIGACLCHNRAVARSLETSDDTESAGAAAPQPATSDRVPIGTQQKP